MNLPCINCLILGRCKARVLNLTDDFRDIDLHYDMAMAIHKLINECCILKEYSMQCITTQGIEHHQLDVNKVNGIVDYLMNGIIQEEKYEEYEE